ncbi:GNAT family N-acetyltransferase [Falsiroseomonas sp. HW251]|uniref:GNAT family N-acetyltransferase n=1 Tax=Falsiroseomonas sp. HW251 TaxID=3390998 RepID=UPI003D31163F
MGIVPSLLVHRVAGLPSGFEELAADALADGQRLLEVLREDWESGAVRFDGAGEALFVAVAGGALVGIGGLTRDPYLADDRAGRVRRLYVRRASRRHGVGGALVGAIAAAAAAAGWPRLRVRAPAAAFAFYEARGFLRAVGETAASHVMVLDGPR